MGRRGFACGSATLALAFAGSSLAERHAANQWLPRVLFIFSLLALGSALVAWIWPGNGEAVTDKVRTTGKDIQRMLRGFKDSGLNQATTTFVGGSGTVDGLDTNARHAVLSVGADVRVSDIKQRTKL